MRAVKNWNFLLALFGLFAVAACDAKRPMSADIPRLDESVEAASLESPVYVSVHDDNSLVLNGEPITEEALLQYFSNLPPSERQKRVLLTASENAKYGTVMRVISGIKGAGITNLGLLTKPN